MAVRSSASSVSSRPSPVAVWPEVAARERSSKSTQTTGPQPTAREPRSLLSISPLRLCMTIETLERSCNRSKCVAHNSRPTETSSPTCEASEQSKQGNLTLPCLKPRRLHNVHSVVRGVQAGAVRRRLPSRDFRIAASPSTDSRSHR